MKALIKFFLNNDKLTKIIMIFIFVLGIQSTKNILREKTPNVNLGAVRIMTFYPGATSDEVEVEITKRIEDKLREVKGIKKVESRSQINMSIIKIMINIDNFEAKKVIDDIRTQLEKVNNLPTSATKPSLLEINTEEYSVIELAIIGDNEGRKRDNYADILFDEIGEIKGIIKVDKYGYANREFSVKLNLDKMREYDIGIDEISSALRSRNITIPAGNLQGDKNQAFVRIDAKTKNIKDLENAVIRSNFEGNIIYLKDIANVFDDKENLESKTKINEKDATILTVKKQSGIDTINIASKIKKRVEEIQVEYNSKFEIVYFVNAARDVQDQFDILMGNMLSGGVIVLIFLLIFLPGMIGVMATFTIPITIFLTIMYMQATNMTLNTITMLAFIIILGMIVDDSVMISEGFGELIKDGYSIKDAAAKCIGDVWVPVVSTSLTTIFSFIPMFMTKGVIGSFIAGIPIIVTVSLTMELLDSFFMLPTRLRMIGSSVVKKIRKDKLANKSGDWFDKFKDKFVKLTYICVKHRYMSLGGFFIIMIVSFFFLSINQVILFPTENVLLYKARFETNTGDSLDITAQAAERLTKDIKNIIGKENIENIVAYIGQSGTGLTEDLQQNHHIGELRIFIGKEQSFKLDYKKILHDVRTSPKDYLTKFEILQEGSGPGVGRAIEANIRSNNEENLYKVLNYVYDRISKVKGIINLETNDYKNDDEIFIKLDYDKIARMGLNITSIGNDIKAGISGVYITNLTIDNNDFYIKAVFDDNFRQSEEDLKKLFIRERNGNLVPITEIAKFDRKPGSTMKNRYNFKKAVTVRSNVDEMYLTALEGNAKLREYFNEISPNYPDVSLVFAGEQESAEESFASLKIAMIFAIFAVFGTLVFVNASYLLPLIIMTTIPLGLLGFAIAFYFHQRALSFLAFVGVIGLAGVVVNSGVILVTFIEIFRKQDRKGDLDTILAKASGSRLRAVVTSSLTTIVGLMPTAYGIGGRDATLIPVTLSMAWGLMSSTLLSLIWIPCCYGIIDDLVNLVRRMKIAYRGFKRKRKFNSQ